MLRKPLLPASKTEAQQAFLAVSSPLQLKGEFLVFCHFFSSFSFSLFVSTYLLLSCTESGQNNSKYSNHKQKDNWLPAKLSKLKEKKKISLFWSSSVLLVTYKVTVVIMKTTFTMLRTVCKEGLHLFSFFFTVVVASMSFSFCTIILFPFIAVFFFSYSEINECVRGLHKCSSDAFCNNTKGSYNCTCKHGFTGNGRECRGRNWIQ